MYAVKSWKSSDGWQLESERHLHAPHPALHRVLLAHFLQHTSKFNTRRSLPKCSRSNKCSIVSADPRCTTCRCLDASRAPQSAQALAIEMLVRCNEVCQIEIKCVNVERMLIRSQDGLTRWTGGDSSKPGGLRACASLEVQNLCLSPRVSSLVTFRLSKDTAYIDDRSSSRRNGE